MMEILQPNIPSDSYHETFNSLDSSDLFGSVESSPIIVQKQLQPSNFTQGYRNTLIGVVLPPPPTWVEKRKSRSQSSTTALAEVPKAAKSLVDALTAAFAQNDALSPIKATSKITIPTPPSEVQESSSIHNFTSTPTLQGTLSTIVNYSTPPLHASNDTIQTADGAAPHTELLSSSIWPSPVPSRRLRSGGYTHKLALLQEELEVALEADVAFVHEGDKVYQTNPIALTLNLRHLITTKPVNARISRKPHQKQSYALLIPEPEAEFVASLTEAFGPGSVMRGSGPRPQAKQNGSKRRRSLSVEGQSSVAGDGRTSGGAASTIDGADDGTMIGPPKQKKRRTHEGGRKGANKQPRVVSTQVQELPTADPIDIALESVMDLTRQLKRLIKGKSRLEREELSRIKGLMDNIKDSWHTKRLGEDLVKDTGLLETLVHLGTLTEGEIGYGDEHGLRQLGQSLHQLLSSDRGNNQGLML